MISTLFGTGSATVSATRRAGAILACLLVWGTAWPAARAPALLDPATRATLARAIAASPGFDNRFAAEVWLVDMSRRLAHFVPDVTRRLALLRDVHAAASQAGVSPELVLAIIEVESHFKRFALSSAGARGLMQVMPFWRDEIGTADDNLFARATNLRYGCAILAVYLEREHGRLAPALARYNGSTGRTVYSDRVLAALRRHWRTD